MKPKNADIIGAILVSAAILGAAAEKETEESKFDGDKIRKQAEDVGNRYYHIYLGFKDAGFNDEQAFALVLETIRRNA